jgi:hypothetical protein
VHGCEPDRLGDVAGLADDLEVGLGLEQQVEARPHDGVVVGDDEWRGLSPRPAP